MKEKFKFKLDSLKSNRFFLKENIRNNALDKFLTENKMSNEDLLFLSFFMVSKSLSINLKRKFIYYFGDKFLEKKTKMKLFIDNKNSEELKNYAHIIPKSSKILKNKKK